MGPIDPFFTWLAAQPAFVAVGLGIAFCLVIAPLMLAAVALGLTRLEAKVGRIVSASGMIATGSLQWKPLRRALLREMPWLSKAFSKPHA
jgi:hypothetical protein